MELSDIFQRFQLDLLSSDWVQHVWKEEFSSPLELPSDYEIQLEFNLFEVVKDTRKQIRRWLDDNSVFDSSNTSLNATFSSNPKSWNALVKKVNHKSLLCVLSSLITQYTNESDEMSKEKAFEAAKLYFILLSIDGAHIFKVYNSVVFTQAIELFNRVSSLNSNSVSAKQSTKGRKRKSFTDSQENGSSEPEQLSFDARRKLLSQLISLLECLVYCLNKFSLRNDPDAISSIIPLLVQMAAIEKTTSALFDQVPLKGTTAYAAHLSYSAINILCSEFHGDINESLRDLVKALRTSLCIFDQPSWQVVSKESQIVQDHIMKFILKLVDNLGEPSFVKITALVQQICVSIPDKADIRAKYVQMIVDLVYKFPLKLYFKVVLWIISLCCADSVKNRLSGIEIITKLLYLPDRSYNFTNDRISGESNSKRSSVSSYKSDLSENPESLKVKHKLLFSAILSRCKDISPRVRAKSLGVLAPLILSKEYFITEIIEEIFLFSFNSADQPEKQFFDFQTFFRSKLFEKEESINPLPSCMVILELFERLTHDEKVFVRKNSLHVISNICLLHENYLEKNRLDLLVFACTDISVGIRKMIVQDLTTLLLQYPSHHLLPNCWVEGVVPLFAENEVKAQEKVLEVAEMVILDNIVPYDKVSTPEHKLPWLLISLITKYDMRKLFKFACGYWCNAGKIKDNFIKHLQTYIGTENNITAWYFLVCISEFKNLPNSTPILNYFYNNIFKSPKVDELSSSLVMQALVLNSKELPSNKQEELCDNLKSSLDSFEIPSPLISASVDIIHILNLTDAKQWAKQLIPICEQKAKVRLKKLNELDGGSQMKKDELFCRMIFTMAELSLICPDVVSGDTITLLINVVDISSWEHATLSTELLKMGKLHAVTVCVLGKLCLQNSITAKTIVPVLGNLVGVNSPKEVKVNANIALTDLCVRFSSLVEPYFGDMCVCLKDPNPDVRRNILTLITRLVQEDFLKIRAHVLIYLLSMIKDTSKEIRDFTLSFIVNSILKKNPSIMSQHFIKAILFLNNFEGASSNVKDTVSPQEKAAFCLTGIQQMESRREIYRFMLANMLDDMKFRTRFKICVEILDPVSEGEIPLEGEGVNVLKDSLYILGCEEIKMSVRRSGKDQDDEDEEAEPVAYAKDTIMSQLFSSLMKQTLTDHLVPIIIKLKRKLMSLNSPLVRDLMLSLREMLKDFKEQVDEILAADPELAAEVAHDLAQMEKNEKERNQISSPLGEDSQQDSIMAEMKKVAHRISIGVLRHGPSIIPPENSQEATQDAMNTSCEGRLRLASLSPELENVNISPVVRLENVASNEPPSTPFAPSSSSSSISSLSSQSSSKGSRSTRSSK